jgi:hypothetical protein
MTAVVTAVLTIDGGQGYEDKQTGRITYSRPPRARFDCHLCGGEEGPVIGAEPVKDFTRAIRTDHRARCSATTQHQQGAQAA